MPRFSSSAELPLTVDKESAVTLPSQLAGQLRSLIAAGSLAASDPLPSSRSLAERLGVSRGSVVAAYEQLAGEGYLCADRGGTRVSAVPVRVRAPKRTGEYPGRGCGLASESAEGAGQAVRAEDRPIDLTPGRPDTSLLATASWRAAWRAAAAEPGQSFPATGSPELREELSRYLRLTRSVVCDPSEVLISAGAREAFRLLLSEIRRQKHNRSLCIAVENPGYPSLSKIPAASGHRVVPVEVDGQGLNPAVLERASPPDLVLVAPSHQYPLGASMPLARRLELLDWAQENGAYIIEDDYDSELRYVGEPLPALAALARQSGRERVITLGSFTKTLAPGLGLGYVLAPRELIRGLIELREVLGLPVSSTVQAAMTNFLRDGGVGRHVARMRRVYRRRREILLSILAPQTLPGQVRVVPMDGGLHAVIELGSVGPAGEELLVSAAGQAGVKVAALGDYWAHSGSAETRRACGLVVGFGGPAEHALAQGLRTLRAVLVHVLKERTGSLKAGAGAVPDGTAPAPALTSSSREV